MACLPGPARGAVPRSASRRLTAIPADPDADGTGLGLTAWIAAEVEELGALARRDGAHTAVLAVGPGRWQSLRFVLWADAAAPDEAATERYEVAHLSKPGLGGLPNGRHWQPNTRPGPPVFPARGGPVRRRCRTVSRRVDGRVRGPGASVPGLHGRSGRRAARLVIPGEIPVNGCRRADRRPIRSARSVSPVRWPGCGSAGR